MSNLVNFISAVARVAYDKTSDYITYYMPWYLETLEEITNDNVDINDNDSNEYSINSIASPSGIDVDQIVEKEEVEHIETPTVVDRPNPLNDSILDYREVLNVSKYTDETQNKRIYEETGFIEQYKIFFDVPSHIVDNIYLGSAFNAANYNTLKEYNIKVIFNITKEISHHFSKEFVYVQYKIYDNNKESILEYAIHAYEQILYHQQNTPGNILIHCYMGKSRSAAIVLYYLMKTKKHPDGKDYSFDDALNFIRSKRKLVNPTFRFTKDLAKSNSMPNVTKVEPTELTDIYDVDNEFVDKKLPSEHLLHLSTSPTTLQKSINHNYL